MKTILEIILLWLILSEVLVKGWEHWGIINPPLVWAYTVTTGFAIFYLLSFLCLSRQAVYQTRIDECAAAKKLLEQEVLKKRQSSRKGK